MARDNSVYNRLATDEIGEDLKPVPFRESQRPWILRASNIWFVHAGLLLLWILLYVMPLVGDTMSKETPGTCDCGPRHLFTPAPSEAQQYEYRTYTDGIPGDALEESKYMGEPNDENEENWARLRRLGFIDLEHHEVEKLLNTTVDPKTSYVGGVGVFHQLHCVYSMRKMLYWPESIPMMKDHIIHCTELLRQAIMCHGDVDIDTHAFDPDTKLLDIHFPTYKGPKLCKKIEPLIEWGEQRRSKLYWNFPEGQHE